MPSRRALLPALAFALLQAVTACGAGSPSTSAPASPQPRVLVIGAGLAGLSAAQHLHQNGWTEVTVLEARGEIGGRTRSPTTLGPALDIGASWLHGIGDHPLHDRALELGLDTHRTDYDSAMLHTPGGIADAQTTARVEAYAEALARAIDWADGDDTIAEVASELPARHADALPRPLRNSVIADYEEEFAASAALLPVKAVREGDELVGDDVLLASGYAPLVADLARGLEIQLDTVVSAIDYRETDIQVTTSRGVLAADKVIVTVPLGVLQAGAIAFTPPLPADKQLAIRSLGSGLLNKLYLRFPEVFWDTSFQIAHYAHADKGRWVSWYDLSRLTGEPVLLGFNTGDAAVAVEQLDDAATVDDAMAVLRAMYGDDIPDPDGRIITRWGKDPFARGSYSYLARAADSRLRDALAAEVERRLYFAGEATDRANPATTQGAYHSGLRAAQALAQDHL